MAMDSIIEQLLEWNLISPARQVAFEVLHSVHQGGYAGDLLVALSAKLDSRDAGLCSEIVFGCLRYQAQIDYQISRLARGQLDIDVLVGLRMGVYQLRYLDRIPAHAAVSDSVELVKHARKASAAGLVNAVLRKVDRKPIAWPDRATELSLPEWLIDKWERQFGHELAEKIATASLQPAETYIASTGRIQDIGAQSVVPMLDLHPGLTLLDLCAAPGNKTAQAIAEGASTIACDLHWHRLKQLQELACERVVADGTQPLPFRATFDRILVDAPCSGTGTLGRNPEIKWRLQPGDANLFSARQQKMLDQARRFMKPGGRIVYSTCALENEENQNVIRSLRLRAETHLRLPGRDPGDGFFAAVITLV
jgi:16S rRNA (cytosine967-C5)-methyltransferase